MTKTPKPENDVIIGPLGPIRPTSSAGISTRDAATADSSKFRWRMPQACEFNQKIC